MAERGGFETVSKIRHFIRYIGKTDRFCKCKLFVIRVKARQNDPTLSGSVRVSFVNVRYRYGYPN